MNVLIYFVVGGREIRIRKRKGEKEKEKEREKISGKESDKIMF